MRKTGKHKERDMRCGPIPSYIMGLDDPGDMDAPIGSKKWAHGLRYTLYRLAKDSTAKLQEFKDYLSLMERHRGYQYLPDAQGTPFVSVHAFLVTPTPFGAGYDPAVVDAIMAETRDMLLVDTVKEAQKQKNLAADAANADMRPAHRPSKSSDTNEKDVTTFSTDERGNSSTYALRRLA